MNPRQRTAAVGTKFHSDGSVRSFPGLSLVSPVTPRTEQYGLLAQLHSGLRRRPFAGSFAFLPPSSWHMTVKDLVCDQVRTVEHWSRGWPLDLDFPDVERRLGELLDTAIRPCTLSMRFDTLLDYETTIKPFLVPADGATERYLRELRETVARTTGIRHPNHDCYRFHISLAYQLVELEEAERALLMETLERWNDIFRRTFATLRISEPYLTSFPDMHSFPPLSTLLA